MPSPPPIPMEPSTPVRIVLQAQEWQTVLNALAEAPFRLSAPLIQRITEQAHQAAQHPEQPL